MQRARRAALCAVLALLGSFALAGCRTEPSVAVYVGDTRYTQAEVDRIVAAANSAKNAVLTADPQWVVRLIVTRDLAKQLAAEKGVKVEPGQVDALSQRWSSFANSEYARLWAEVMVREFALQETVTPAPVSDDDMLRFYRSGVSAGLFGPGLALEDLREQLNGPRFAVLIGLRRLIADAVVSHHVSINPRFTPLALPILQQSPSGRLYQVAVPFEADTTTGVHDSA
jgi:hypothetical protein